MEELGQRKNQQWPNPKQHDKDGRLSRSQLGEKNITQADQLASDSAWHPVTYSIKIWLVTSKNCVPVNKNIVEGPVNHSSENSTLYTKELTNLCWLPTKPTKHWKMIHDYYEPSGKPQESEVSLIAYKQVFTSNLSNRLKINNCTQDQALVVHASNPSPQKEETGESL